MRIRWTTRIAVLIGLVTLVAGVAGRPAHHAVSVGSVTVHAGRSTPAS
jgi:hypothetical protein